MPPVLVSRIDGKLALIDGHSRTFAAYETGALEILADVYELYQIEGSQALYEHIHRRGPALGIRTIVDLANRIAEPDEHRRLWTGYCERWLAEMGE